MYSTVEYILLGVENLWVTQTVAEASLKIANFNRAYSEQKESRIEPERSVAREKRFGECGRNVCYAYEILKIAVWWKSEKIL